MQELALGTPKGKGERIIELRRLCGKHRIVPASYKLEGVEKEGEFAQRNSTVAGVWRGRYDGKVVALKVLRVSQNDPDRQRIKSVSASCDLRRLLAGFLKDGVAVLQRSGVDETVQEH